MVVVVRMLVRRLLLLVPLLLGCVTFIALLRPAWRAARLDPIATLRRN